MAWTGVLAFVVCAALVASAQAQTPNPFGAPVPVDPTLGDVLSTTANDGDGVGVVPGADLCRSAPHREISLPSDDAAHRETYLEWWWWYGEVATKDGQRVGYLLFWESKPWAEAQIVHYAITDLNKGTFHSGYDRLSGRPPAEENRFSLRTANTSAAGGGGRDRIALEVDDYRLDLSLKTIKPPAKLGYRSSFCNDLYMYSRVRMPTKGTLTHKGRQLQVSGTSHFDRAWGFSPAFLIANVAALSFELDDGRDILVADIRLRENGEEYSYRTGYVSERDGDVTILHRPDFTLEPTGLSWRRDASCTYPTEWAVEVAGERLVAKAAVPSTEIRMHDDPATLALWPEWPTIWDGPTTVTGTTTGGHGWLDLTHYCYL